MREPCMCGALDCPSCGRAQGVPFCPYCKQAMLDEDDDHSECEKSYEEYVNQKIQDEIERRHNPIW